MSNHSIKILRQIIPLSHCIPKNYFLSNSFMMLTPALAPILSAPASIIASTVSRSLIPPEALTFSLSPTVSFINLTSATLAPPLLNPVDVLTKSAPAASDSSQAFTISSSERRQVSIITLTNASKE